jgi:hypothetical protein
MKLIVVIAGICLTGLAVVLFVHFLRRYLGIGREGGYLVAVGTIVASAATFAYEMHQTGSRQPWSDAGENAMRSGVFSQALWAAVLVLTGVPLAVKLYRSWIGGHVTKQEKAAGAAGARAWLRPANLVLALTASICAAEGFGYPFWSVLALAVLALLAYPMFALSGRAEATRSAADGAENLAAERETVLLLLEAGRITADECTELLNALGSTLRAPEPKGVVIAPEHRTMLVGASMVLIGFFLPWFTINLGKEMQHVASEIGGQMNQFAEQMPNGNGMFNFQAMSVNVNGGDVQNGLGWLILLMSLVPALLPMVAGHLEGQTRRTIGMLSLGAGTLIVAYLVTSNLRFLNVGIILVSLGYFAQWICLLKRAGAVHAAPGGIGEHA